MQQVFFDDDVAPEISFSNDLLFGLELFRKQLQEWPAEGLEIDTQQLPNGTLSTAH